MSKEKQLADRVTKQIFFDMVIGKMRQQAKPGVSKGVLGLRAGDGSRCSLGWLIVDSKYKKSFEKLCPNAVMIDLLGMPDLGWTFYDDLQDAHDRSAKSKDWWPAFVKEMHKVATTHFLNPRSLQS
jgi:hypothetical protein